MRQIHLEKLLLKSMKVDEIQTVNIKLIEYRKIEVEKYFYKNDYFNLKLSKTNLVTKCEKKNLIKNMIRVKMNVYSRLL